MNNNTIQINSYLQNEMSAEERAAFEILLASDKALQYELEVQQNIMNAAVNAGIKIEFAHAMRQEFIYRRFIKWGVVVFIGIVLLLVFVFRQQIFPKRLFAEKQAGIATQQNLLLAKPFINPPLAAADVPFSEYNFDAAKGDTIFYPSGSIICFPSHCFVDASGNVVKGLVQVKYREFADPVDFFVSGIPMDYDSAGVKYNFESSGMCEVVAFQHNIPVFVNPKAKPQVNLSGNNKSALHNLYVLDTVSRKWVLMGKDNITEVKKLGKAGNTSPIAKEDAIAERTMTAPVKPIKATPGRQAFSIEIEPGSFEELLTYDKQKFEVAETADNTYRASDADEHWEHVQLKKTAVEGLYTVTFSNRQRTVSYKVRPVLSGADYDAALKIFNEKNRAYELAVQKRILFEQAASDSIQSKNKQLTEKWNAENKRNNELNQLISERNSQMREKQRLQQETNIKQLKAQQDFWQQQQEAATAQQLIFEKNRQKYWKDLNLSTEIIRSFAINSFGVWNCDHPEYPDKEISIEPVYTYNEKDTIYLPFASVVYKGFNGITQFPSTMPIRVIPGSENMILSIRDGLLYYFSYKDFMAAAIGRDKKKFTFKMRRSEKPVSSYTEVKELIDKL